MSALLTGCTVAAKSNPTDDTSSATSERTSTAAQDQDLFDLLEPNYPLAVDTEGVRSMSVVVALQGCDALDDGASTDDLFAGIMEGVSLAEADVVTSTAAATVVAGIRVYCPEYQTEMIETVDNM
jgi:hypothetical protein